MLARCPACPSSLRVAPPSPGGFLEVACSGCGTSVIAQSPGADAGDEAWHEHRARELAHEHDLDPTLACSVVLGLLSLSQALDREVFGAQQVLPRAPQRAGSPAVVSEANVDPGFLEPVAEGRLTLPEAIARGNRETYASRLAERHDLPDDLAYMVTDNRLALREAVVRAKRMLTPSRPRTAPRRITRLQGIVGGLLTLGVLTAVAVSAWHSATSSPVPSVPPRLAASAASSVEPPNGEVSSDVETKAPARAPAVQVDRDPTGNLVRLTGPDPGSVLASFCALSGATCVPLELTETVPPSPDAFFGIFQTLGETPEVRAIRIRRDSRSRRWVAGNGLAPIASGVAPTLPAGARRIPVDG